MHHQQPALTPLPTPAPGTAPANHPLPARTRIPACTLAPLPQAAAAQAVLSAQAQHAAFQQFLLQLVQGLGVLHGECACWLCWGLVGGQPRGLFVRPTAGSCCVLPAQKHHPHISSHAG